VFFGLDLGTTNTKAVLLDQNGELLARLTITANSQGVANSALIWYEHFCQALDYFQSQGHLREQKIICSITAQGGTFVLLDNNFEPISRAYSWTENADDKIVQELRQSVDSRRYYRTTGWQPKGWLAVCKFKELFTKSKALKDFRFFSTVPEFVYSQLTGKFVTDITNAQITGICDFNKCQWDQQIVSWADLESKNLPSIATGLKVIADEVTSRWGKISFVTSSHDQYAAMQAAGLQKDKNIMLGTGTAWVINVRSSEPVFDDENFLTHPGRDLYANCYGNIISLGPVGGGFDKLLNKLSLNTKQLAEIEDVFGSDDIPTEGVGVDMEGVFIKTACEGIISIRRYMECGAAAVVFMLDRFELSKNIDRIIMTGGAVASHFWPQLIADLCNIMVEAVDFPEFTAYGAALHAKAAVMGKTGQGPVLETNKSRIYEPVNADAYRHWYLEHQKAVIEKLILDR